MAGTAKVLSDMSNSREEITHIVDLLSRKRNIKVDIAEIVKEQPVESAVFAVLAGVFSALLLHKSKNLLKFILLVYVTKQSISYLLKK